MSDRYKTGAVPNGDDRFMGTHPDDGLPANLPEVVSQEEWSVARRRLLAEEKQLTRARDAVNAERRRLPMVRIDKEYVFDTPAARPGCWTSSRGAGS